MWCKYVFFYVCISEKAMAPHSSTLALKIPWMEEPGRLQSMGSLRVGHDWATSLSLSIFWQFVEFSLLWSFLPVGRVVWVGCQDFLVREACVGVWWVELDFFSLECNEVSSNELWDVNGFGVTLGSLYIEAQGYVPVLLENLLGMSCSGACWPLGGAWFQCRYGGIWWARLIFPGVRSSLVFSGFGLKPPAFGFQSYFYSSLKTSPSIQHHW